MSAYKLVPKGYQNEEGWLNYKLNKDNVRVLLCSHELY